MPDFASPELIAWGSLALVWVIERGLKILKHRGVDLQKVAADTRILAETWAPAEHERIVKRIDMLYELHDVRGEDGVPVWYVRASDQRSLHEALSALAESTKTQTTVMQKMLAALETRRVEDAAAHDAILREVKKA